MTGPTNPDGKRAASLFQWLYAANVLRFADSGIASPARSHRGKELYFFPLVHQYRGIVHHQSVGLAKGWIPRSPVHSCLSEQAGRIANTIAIRMMAAFWQVNVSRIIL